MSFFFFFNQERPPNISSPSDKRFLKIPVTHICIPVVKVLSARHKTVAHIQISHTLSPPCQSLRNNRCCPEAHVYSLHDSRDSRLASPQRFPIHCARHPALFSVVKVQTVGTPSRKERAKIIHITGLGASFPAVTTGKAHTAVCLGEAGGCGVQTDGASRMRSQSDQECGRRALVKGFLGELHPCPSMWATSTSDTRPVGASGMWRFLKSISGRWKV